MIKSHGLDCYQWPINVCYLFMFDYSLIVSSPILVNHFFVKKSVITGKKTFWLSQSFGTKGLIIGVIVVIRYYIY